MKSIKRKHGVSVFHAYKTMPAPIEKLKKLAFRIYTDEKIPPKKSVHCILCSDFYIKKLNTRFRNKPCPTDVLSFNYDEDDFLGEIYLSLQRAIVQAKHFHVSYADEIERLFIHGMFHLLGFDHKKPFDRKKMEAKESKYLSE